MDPDSRETNHCRGFSDDEEEDDEYGSSSTIDY